MRCDLAPLRRGRVDPGRVVARGVKDHCVTWPRRVDCGEQALNVEACAIGAEPGVLSCNGAALVNDLTMVRPGWLADPDLSFGAKVRHQLDGESNGAGAAWGLHHLDATRHGRLQITPRRAGGAEEEGAHDFQVARVASDRLVHLGRRRGEKATLRLAYRPKDRRGAALIHVDALGEVHLVRTRVSLEALNDAEDRVAGERLNTCREVRASHARNPSRRTTRFFARG